MKVTFDAAKDNENQRKHGVSLAEAALMDWDAALIWQDTRHDYGEARMIALGRIRDRLYRAVFGDRESTRRVISLRKTNQREYDHYEQETN